jgi:hypothetical protein
MSLLERLQQLEPCRAQVIVPASLLGAKQERQRLKPLPLCKLTFAILRIS